MLDLSESVFFWQVSHFKDDVLLPLLVLLCRDGAGLDATISSDFLRFSHCDLHLLWCPVADKPGGSCMLRLRYQIHATTPNTATSRQPPSAQTSAPPTTDTGGESSSCDAPNKLGPCGEGTGAGGGGDGAENTSDDCELLTWTTVALVMTIAQTEREDAWRLGKSSSIPVPLLTFAAML